MDPGRPDPSAPDVRIQMKRWLDHWQRVGPLLEAERWKRLAAMTDDEARHISRDLLDLWQPDWSGDGGEELFLHQRVFARARRTVQAGERQRPASGR